MCLTDMPLSFRTSSTDPDGRLCGGTERRRRGDLRHRGQCTPDRLHGVRQDGGAFFPILTLLDEEPSHSVGVLYIAPLKALINDQFGRLTELCEEAGIPVTRWHGDVPQSQKRKLLRKPAAFSRSRRNLWNP